MESYDHTTGLYLPTPTLTSNYAAVPDEIRAQYSSQASLLYQELQLALGQDKMADNVADLFTKAVGRGVLERLLDPLLGYAQPTLNQHSKP